jgi:hypothetical protein
VGKFNDWAEVTVVSIVAGSLVVSELAPDLHPSRVDPSRAVLMLPGAPRLNHMDPEPPPQPESLWAPAIALSTSTATGLLVTLPAPKA